MNTEILCQQYKEGKIDFWEKISLDKDESLLYACLIPGTLEFCRYLIETGENVDDVNKGTSCLTLVVKNDLLEKTQLLLEYGADPDPILDTEGKSPLDYAILNQNVTMVRLLLSYKAYRYTLSVDDIPSTVIYHLLPMQRIKPIIENFFDTSYFKIRREHIRRMEIKCKKNLKSGNCFMLESLLRDGLNPDLYIGHIPLIYKWYLNHPNSYQGLLILLSYGANPLLSVKNDPDNNLLKYLAICDNGNILRWVSSYLYDKDLQQELLLTAVEYLNFNTVCDLHAIGVDLNENNVLEYALQSWPSSYMIVNYLVPHCFLTSRIVEFLLNEEFYYPPYIVPAPKIEDYLLKLREEKVSKHEHKIEKFSKIIQEFPKLKNRLVEDLINIKQQCENIKDLWLAKSEELQNNILKYSSLCSELENSKQEYEKSKQECEKFKEELEISKQECENSTKESENWYNDQVKLLSDYLEIIRQNNLKDMKENQILNQKYQEQVDKYSKLCSEVETLKNEVEERKRYYDNEISQSFQMLEEMRKSNEEDEKYNEFINTKLQEEKNCYIACFERNNSLEDENKILRDQIQKLMVNNQMLKNEISDFNGCRPCFNSFVSSVFSDEESDIFGVPVYRKFRDCYDCEDESLRNRSEIRFHF